MSTGISSHAVIRTDYLPEQIIQTGTGDVEIKVPNVRDRNSSEIYFNSSLLPFYLKPAKTSKSRYHAMGSWPSARKHQRCDFTKLLDRFQ
ncbi:MAG: hypothetical protein ACTS73_01780 [Arsenophonus sp. NEOnobi-MAG3]